MGPQASLTKNVHFPKKSAFCNIGYNIDIDIGYNKDVGYIIYNPGPRTPQMGLLYKKQNIQRAAKLRSGHRAWTFSFLGIIGALGFLNWIHFVFAWIELSWVAWSWVQQDLIEFNWTDLILIVLNSIGLSWIQLNWIVSSCIFELNWIESGRGTVGQLRLTAGDIEKYNKNK